MKKKKRWKKKNILLNGNSKKSWHSDKSWKHFLLFTFTHFYFIPFAFTLHHILINSLFDLEDSVVQVLIWLNKKCGINSFWHPFMRLLVLSWLSIFHVVRYWFHLHYSTHVYCWECYTPFQSDFICWVIILERFELKHTFK